LDRELDALLEQIEDKVEENGEASKEAMDALELFAKAIYVKINRIGGYLTAMETCASHCRAQAERFTTRARRGKQNSSHRQSARSISKLKYWPSRTPTMITSPWMTQSEGKAAGSVTLMQAS
jgi:hypothetical protein